MIFCKETIEKKITTQLRLELDYAFVTTAQSELSKCSAVEVESHYSDKVILIVEVEVNKVDALTQSIINKSGAKAMVSPVEHN